MDPNNPSTPTEGSNLGKLEEDLQKLTKEASSQVPPVTPSVPSPEPAIVDTPTPAPTAGPAVVPVAPIGTEQTPPAEKKTSPMLIVALALMVLAILAAIAYVVGMKFFSPSAVSTPAPTSVLNTPAQLTPTVEPVIPTTVASPSALPSGSPNSSASPSAMPLATP